MPQSLTGGEDGKKAPSFLSVSADCSSIHILCIIVLCPFSCLELIIEEQVEKLNATLRGIETLSVVARDTVSKLIELIGADEVGGERDRRRERRKEGKREGGGAGGMVDRRV